MSKGIHDYRQSNYHPSKRASKKDIIRFSMLQYLLSTAKDLLKLLFDHLHTTLLYGMNSSSTLVDLFYMPVLKNCVPWLRINKY